MNDCFFRIDVYLELKKFTKELSIKIPCGNDFDSFIFNAINICSNGVKFSKGIFSPDWYLKIYDETDFKNFVNIINLNKNIEVL